MNNEIKMNIPPAAEARRIRAQGEYEKAKKQAAEIEAKIQAAVARGETSVGGDGYIEQPVKAKLEAMGYKCDVGSQYNETYWSVSWSG
jgi:hypothetical protein